MTYTEVRFLASEVMEMAPNETNETTGAAAHADDQDRAAWVSWRADLERRADGLICRGCGRDDYRVREVTRAYRVGNTGDTVTLTTLALVSDYCGETLFDPKADAQLDRAVQAVRNSRDGTNGTHEGLRAAGTAYVYEGQ